MNELRGVRLNPPFRPVLGSAYEVHLSLL
jgi:hypothetical protein